MSDRSHSHHIIDYIEINVLDMSVAKRFYEAAFQWKFNEYGDAYAGIQKGDGEAGGLRLVETNVTGGPLVILYSINLEESLRQVKEAGGEISLDIISFPGGRRFQFRDPSGNELAVWSDK
ncbi:MAG: VOC family protein [Planctomycetales bacterium]|nr:VOC family protein [Planctomycetales bacterium]